MMFHLPSNQASPISVMRLIKYSPITSLITDNTPAIRPMSFSIKNIRFSLAKKYIPANAKNGNAAKVFADARP